MHARFDELSGTASGAEVKPRPRAGPTAWLIFFLSVFFGTFAVLSLAWTIFFDKRFSRAYEPLLVVMYVLALMSGWPAIIHYRLRNLLAVRGLAFVAAMSGLALAAYPIYHGFTDSPPSGDDTFLAGLIILIALVHGVLAAEYPALRARYAYSEKSGQWLRSHATKKRLADAGALAEGAPLTVDAVLGAEIAATRRGALHILLFLDSEPGGEHYICVTRVFKPKFFSLKFSRPSLRHRIVRADWRQIEQVRAGFGEFRKTVFIEPASAAVGNEMRSGARRR